MRKIKRLGILIGSVVIGFIVIVGICNYKFEDIVANRIYNNIDDLPRQKFGTFIIPPGNLHGQKGLVFALIKELIDEHKIESFVSNWDGIYYIVGDTISVDYDDNKLDRIMDRIKNIEYVDSVIIVSTPHILERALYIADSHDLDAIGFNVESRLDTLTIQPGGLQKYCKRVKFLWTRLFKTED